MNKYILSLTILGCGIIGSAARMKASTQSDYVAILDASVKNILGKNVAISAATSDQRTNIQGLLTETQPKIIKKYKDTITAAATTFKEIDDDKKRIRTEALGEATKVKTEAIENLNTDQKTKSAAFETARNATPRPKNADQLGKDARTARELFNDARSADPKKNPGKGIKETYDAAVRDANEAYTSAMSMSTPKEILKSAQEAAKETYDKEIAKLKGIQKDIQNLN